VTTTSDATAIFNKANCSSSSAQNAFGCLAAQLLAAKLNIKNGSSNCIQSTVNAADALLAAGGYAGPNGSYNLTSSQRSSAITLKTALDRYNNNQGCQ